MYRISFLVEKFIFESRFLLILPAFLTKLDWKLEEVFFVVWIRGVAFNSATCSSIPSQEKEEITDGDMNYCDKYNTELSTSYSDFVLLFIVNDDTYAKRAAPAITCICGG